MMCDTGDRGYRVCRLVSEGKGGGKGLERPGAKRGGAIEPEGEEKNVPQPPFWGRMGQGGWAREKGGAIVCLFILWSKGGRGACFRVKREGGGGQ